MQDGKSPFSIAGTPSNGCLSIVMLVFGGVRCQHDFGRLDVWKINLDETLNVTPPKTNMDTKISNTKIDGTDTKR